MYIPEFWVGVLFTLATQLIIFFMYGIITGLIASWRNHNG